MNTENLSTLKINKLTQAQYDRELAAGNIDANALYLTPDEEEIVPIELGGTNANTASKARTNLGLGGAATCGTTSSLDSTSTTTLLQAKAGKSLQDQITELNTNMNWKVVGTQTGNAASINLPNDFKEIMIVANANNSTVAVGSWYFIKETLKSEACRCTQGTSASYITIWVSNTWVNIYQGIVNGTDVTSKSTIVVYYR